MSQSQGGMMQKRGATAGMPGPAPTPAAPIASYGPGLADWTRSMQTAGYGPPVNGAPGGVNPEANWATPDSGLLGNPQYLALSRGNSADQAQLLGLLGGNEAQAHQLNQYTGPGGAGFNAQDYGTDTADLAAGNYGVDTMMEPTKQALTAAGVLDANGKWLKRQDDAGNWVPIGGGIPAAPPGMASAYRT